MSHDGRNPSFPRAIPNAMDGIDSLPQVVLFGVFSGCPKVVSREGLRSPPEGISGGCFWEHSESIFQSTNNPNPNYY